MYYFVGFAIIVALVLMTKLPMSSEAIDTLRHLAFLVGLMICGSLIATVIGALAGIYRPYATDA